MSFQSVVFGGPSQASQNLAGQQSNLAGTMQNDFSTQFANQSKALSTLSTNLTPIVNGGVNQQGYSAPELAAMNTSAINNAGAATRNAQQKTATTLAGQGGGGANPAGLASGIQDQINGSIASAGANELAGAQNSIVQGNYATGRQNFFNATQGEQQLASSYDPSKYGSEAAQTLGQASAAQDKIDSEKGSVLGDITAVGKAVGGIAGSFLGGGLGNLDDTGSSSGGEQVKNFFTGGVNTLAGSNNN